MNAYHVPGEVNEIIKGQCPAQLYVRVAGAPTPQYPRFDFAAAYLLNFLSSLSSTNGELHDQTLSLFSKILLEVSKLNESAKDNSHDWAFNEAKKGKDRVL